MTLRNTVFNALAGDVQLNVLGINTVTLYPNFGIDSPAKDQMRFMSIRWGTAEVSPGRDTTAKPIAMSLWAYDREHDFGNIDKILWRARDVLAALVGTVMIGGGAILGVDRAFSSEDLSDETYGAVVRSETYRIVASGI